MRHCTAWLIGPLVALAAPAALGASGGSQARAKTTAPVKTRLFGGRVLKVDPRARLFIITGGASKRYPEVRVVHDKSTHWLGPVRNGQGLKPGDHVQVDVTEQAPGTFRAVTVRVRDPNIKPIPARASPGP